MLAASCLASLRFIRLQRAKHAVGSLVSSRRPKAELVRFPTNLVISSVSQVYNCKIDYLGQLGTRCGGNVKWMLHQW